MANKLYVSPSPDGWRNLGVDEYFLDHLGEEDMLLYFYINTNAVIIGCGQNPWAECRLSAMERDGVQLVRRITGGGAVFHDAGNLNFSFIAGEKIYSVERQLGMILSAVRALGIPCEFSGRNDLLADGRKFSGNAFCARGRVRQHHGTLLLNADLSRLQNYLNVDPRKLQAKGTKSVRSRVCNLSEFVPGLECAQMLEALKAAFRAEYGPYEELHAVPLHGRQAALRPGVLSAADDHSIRIDVKVQQYILRAHVVEKVFVHAQIPPAVRRGGYKEFVRHARPILLWFLFPL